MLKSAKISVLCIFISCGLNLVSASQPVSIKFASKFLIDEERWAKLETDAQLGWKYSFVKFEAGFLHRFSACHWPSCLSSLIISSRLLENNFSLHETEKLVRENVNNLELFLRTFQWAFIELHFIATINLFTRFLIQFLHPRMFSSLTHIKLKTLDASWWKAWKIFNINSQHRLGKAGWYHHCSASTLSQLSFLAFGPSWSASWKC